MTNIIQGFDGPYAFLSNFSPATVLLDGVSYPTVENAFQAAKVTGPAARKDFQVCTPTYAKRLGRRVHLPDGWETTKDSVMLALLLQKFASGTPNAESLLATGDAYLCEGNTWHDNYWGACTCDRCAYSEHKNTLGILLMSIRSMLQQGGNEDGSTQKASL